MRLSLDSRGPLTARWHGMCVKILPRASSDVLSYLLARGMTSFDPNHHFERRNDHVFSPPAMQELKKGFSRNDIWSAKAWQPRVPCHYHAEPSRHSRRSTATGALSSRLTQVSCVKGARSGKSRIFHRLRMPFLAMAFDHLPLDPDSFATSCQSGQVRHIGIDHGGRNMGARTR